MNGVNLLPVSRLRASALRRRIGRWTLGVALYAVLMGVVCVAGLTHAGTAAGDTKREIARANQRLIEADQRIDRAIAASEQLERSLAAMRAVGEHPDWSVLLRLLSQRLADDMVLESVDIEQQAEKKAAPEPAPAAGEAKPAAAEPRGGGEAYKVSIAGVGLTQQRVVGFASELERLGRESDKTSGGVFTSVEIVRTSSVEFAGRTCVRFLIECRLAPRSKP